MFFAKYETDGSRLLEQDEVRRMLSDLEGQKVELESKLILLVNYHSLLFIRRVFFCHYHGLCSRSSFHGSASLVVFSVLCQSCV